MKPQLVKLGICLILAIGAYTPDLADSSISPQRLNVSPSRAIENCHEEECNLLQVNPVLVSNEFSIERLAKEIMAQFDYGFSLEILSDSIPYLKGYDRQKACIQRFKELAVDEGVKYNIPPSIKLAQLILESASMQSKEHLVLFGVKSHSKRDSRVLVNTHEYDDKDKRYGKTDHFKNFKTPWEAFRSHSLTIVNTERTIKDKKKSRVVRRYGSLLKLPITNYQAWAFGLEAKGYATSPTYGEKLISLIERYELYRLDFLVSSIQNS